MTKKATARGNTTRQLNKELRRQNILSVAREIIASKGFDAFTINELASKSGVTIPTVHNLFGKKNDIVLALFRDLVSRIDQVLKQPNLANPIAAAEAFVDNLYQLYSADEAFYRAAFMGGERLGLFEHEMSDGIFRKSLGVIHRVCTQSRDAGYLQGKIDSQLMAEQLFNAQRIARQDWVGGYIGLEQYREQVLIGMLIAFAADAAPEFHESLCGKIEALNSLWRPGWSGAAE